MKITLKPGVLLLICLIFNISCKKTVASNWESTPMGCISEEIATPGSLAPPLTQSQLNTIDNLFRANNLSTANQQFWSIDSAYVMPYGSSTYVNEVEILSYRWYNNLPFLRWNDNYLFYNGAVQQSIIYNGPTPGPDASFRLSLSSLRTIWQNNFMKVGTYWPLNNQVTYPSAAYGDSCLTARPGYLDEAYFDSTVAWQTHLVKAWQVAPAGGYPMIYIEDSTGAPWPSDVFIP